jgi:hypothetical protein
MHVRMHLCTFACVLDKCAHSASITIEVGLQEVCEGVQPILVQAPRLREVHPEQASSIVELAHLHEELGKAIDTSSCGLDYITQPRGTYDSTSMPPFNAPTHITHIVNMSLPPMLVWHMIEIHDKWGGCKSSKNMRSKSRAEVEELDSLVCTHTPWHVQQLGHKCIAR